MSTTTITLTWSISKARDTDGYNVLTLREEGKKICGCNGGGYDMVGAVLGNYLAYKYPEKLRALTTAYTGLCFYDPTYDPGQAHSEHGGTIAEAEAAGKSLGLERYQAAYAAASPTATARHTQPSIDGAYGQAAVMTIAEAIGIAFRRIRHSEKKSRYEVGDKKSLPEGGR